MDIQEEKLNQVFVLKDGRKLGYSEFGNREGKPVFYCHGYLGGRLEAMFPIINKKEINCRLISLDRPGIGLSTYQPKRKILDWPDDVKELADSLGIKKFSIIGVSGGGPYAAACAYKIPERLISVGIVAGMGPYKEVHKLLKQPNRSLFFIIKWLPVLFPLFMLISKRQFNKIKDLEKYKKRMRKSLAKRLPEPDAKIYRESEFLEFLIKHMRDIFQQGIKGPVSEGKLFVKNWGFKLKEIPSSLQVYLWHGEIDKNVAVEIGKYVSSEIPNCKSTYYPKEAHVSLVVNRIEEILKVLTE